MKKNTDRNYGNISLNFVDQPKLMKWAGYAPTDFIWVSIKKFYKTNDCSFDKNQSAPF